MKRTVLAIAIGAAAALATPALGQSVTTQDLQAALRQRDQVIATLEKRIAALEALQGAAAVKTGGPAASAPTAAAASSGDGPAGDNAGDDLVALQALSRGLVERGALLLPKGGLEISPGIAFSHSQRQGLVLVDTPEGISTVSDQRLRTDGLEFAATARYGLPWRSQIQVRVPFAWRRQASALGDGTEVSNHDTYLGDVELELSHQFLVEKGALPALIGGVSWRFPTGRDPFRTPVASIASGGGTHQVTVRATALKTIDPLVVFSTLSYSANLSREEDFGRVHPGNAIAWQLGGLLAVSPETSVNFGFAQQFRFRTSVDDVPIAGSDGIAAVAQFGIDQVLSARTLLDISLGIGLTDDAPDYQLMISLPIRLK
jgi:hypothetical protein